VGSGRLPVRMAGQHEAPLDLARMDPAEGWGGEGHEQSRMPSHRLATLEAGRQELVGVGPVGGRARRAAALPAGAARLQEHPIRLPAGVVHGADLAGLAVGLVDPAGQADRVMAVASLGDQLGPAVVAVAGPVHDPGNTSPTRAGSVMPARPRPAAASLLSRTWTWPAAARPAGRGRPGPDRPASTSAAAPAPHPPATAGRRLGRPGRCWPPSSCRTPSLSCLRVVATHHCLRCHSLAFPRTSSGVRPRVQRPV
jgi:hypothetical protein